MIKVRMRIRTVIMMVVVDLPRAHMEANYRQRRRAGLADARLGGLRRPTGPNHIAQVAPQRQEHTQLPISDVFWGGLGRCPHVVVAAMPDCLKGTSYSAACKYDH